MDPNSDLEMLMARYQQGDFAAATALIHRLSPQLHRFFVVQFACRGDADDLLQETWLRIHKVRHTYRVGEPVLPWFYAAAANEIHGARRRAGVQAQRAAPPSDAEGRDAGENPERALLDRELRASLDQAIEALDDASAEAIRCLLDDRACPGLSAAAFRKRVSRAYAKLRLLLRGRHAE